MPGSGSEVHVDLRTQNHSNSSLRNTFTGKHAGRGGGEKYVVIVKVPLARGVWGSNPEYDCFCI